MWCDVMWFLVVFFQKGQMHEVLFHRVHKVNGIRAQNLSSELEYIKSLCLWGLTCSM